MNTATQPGAAVSTHTPGPWMTHRYTQHFLGEKLCVIRRGDARKCVVASVGPSEISPGRTECEANARLIAAAPKMAAVIRKIYDDNASTALPSDVLREMQDCLTAAGLTR